MPAHDVVMLATDGRHLALMPSLGLFYSGPRPPGKAQHAAPIRSVRLADRTLELVEVDRGRRLWLDLLRLTRLMPVVLGELVQMVGWQRARAMLAHRVAATTDVTQLAAGYGIVAHDTVLPAGWLDAMSEPLRSLPDPAELPPLIQLRLNLVDVDIELVGLREALLERLRAHLDELFDPRETKEPCLLAVVRPKGMPAGARSHGVSLADLDPAEVRALGVAIDRKTPGAFDALLYADADDPENAETVELRLLGARTPQELAAVLSTAQAMSLQRQGDALSYLERVIGRDLDPRLVTQPAAPLLAQVLNLWAMLTRRAGAFERAVGLVDLALQCSPEPDVEQELLYHRGCALLQSTSRKLPAALPGDTHYVDLDGFAHRASAEHVASWQRAVADLEAAVALDESDLFAWARLGVARLLLGERAEKLPVRRRVHLLNSALDAFDHAHATDGPDPAAVARAMQRCRVALEELGRLPWYRRAFGRHPTLACELVAVASDETGPQQPAELRRPRN